MAALLPLKARPQAADGAGAAAVDAVAGVQRTEIGSRERFRPDLKAACFKIMADYRKAGAVDGDTFTNL